MKRPNTIICVRDRDNMTFEQEKALHTASRRLEDAAYFCANDEHVNDPRRRRARRFAAANRDLIAQFGERHRECRDANCVNRGRWHAIDKHTYRVAV